MRESFAGMSYVSSYPRARASSPVMNVHWWLCFLVMMAFLLNEAVGSAPLYGVLILVLAAAAANVPSTMRALSSAGLITWLVPILALVSTLWSSDPLVTLRLALELILTIGMVLVVTEKLDSDEIILATFATTGLICVASLAIHNQQHDGMTGRVTWAGIYHNKNTLCKCAAILALSSATIAVTERYGRLIRMGALVGLLFGIAMAVLARAVATIVACGVGLVCFGLLYLSQFLPRAKRPAHFEIMMAVMVVGAVLGGLLILSNADFFLALVGKDPTLTGRTLLWSYAERFSHDHPWFGVGYQDFWVQGHSEAEFLWEKFHIDSRMGFHFHSLYYFVLVEFGYVGVALTGWYVLATVRRTARWVRNDACPASIFFFVYVIYLLISALQEPELFGYFDPPYALFVVALARSSRTSRHRSVWRAV